MRIVFALARRQGLTAAQLAEALGDVPQATLYRQLSRLHKGGILRVVEERQVRGAAERVYALGDEILDVSQDLATASREDHLRYFTAFVASLLGEFARYLDREHIDLLADGVGYRQVVLYLSDAELRKAAAEINAALLPALGNTPTPDRHRRILATILIPAEEPAGEPPERGGAGGAEQAGDIGTGAGPAHG